MPDPEVRSRLGQMMAGHLVSTRTFQFPNGGAENVFQVPIRVLFQSNFRHFDRQGREHYEVLVPENMSSGLEVANLPLNMFMTPRREVGPLYHEDRLMSVLVAIRGGTRLPPIKYEMTSSGRNVQDGFHRYLASIIAGFTTIPTLQDKAKAKDTSTTPTVGAWQPKWRRRAAPAPEGQG